MDSLVGYRYTFQPTPEELVSHYLKKKTRDPAFTFPLIRDVDIYKYHPCELPGLSSIQSDEQVWYFFCTLGKSGGRGTEVVVCRIKRLSDKGHGLDEEHIVPELVTQQLQDLHLPSSSDNLMEGSLTDDVYMEQPTGFVDSSLPHHVCKLKKAIYGLRQAPRAWFTELRTFLLASGFNNSKCDASLFIRHQFGVEATRSADVLFLSQHKYIRDLLSKTDMLEANAVSTPLWLSDSLRLADGSAPTDATKYRQVVGSLQYLSLTHSDVSFAVNKLSQFMNRSTTAYWNAVKRLLRYLKGMVHHGLLIRRHSSP
ncbi:hypothetical protein LWI29_008165 [Acer saccharum]|uniref:NAC domain-containing protein n=1 Tax=Acer saccharum TaxID=4024 RepID=A0AA39VH17_ACESA|nr:hypothetical protein LWI29_008165 [Acer saccharum]